MKDQVEETVLYGALSVLKRLGLESIVVGDSEFGRKQLLIRLAKQEQPCVIRLISTPSPQGASSSWRSGSQHNPAGRRRCGIGDGKAS